MNNTTERINPLLQEQRDDAFDIARRRIVGPYPDAGGEPQLSHYDERTHSRWPAYVMRIISTLSVMMLMVAFLPSAMRLHDIGLRTFAHAISDLPSAYLAALCIVLMSEIGQVIFSLAAAVMNSKAYRRALWLGAFLCTLIALFGNGEVVRPWEVVSVFIWLEAFVPPILVLIVAQILKGQWLHAIEARHKARLDYNAAHALWRQSHKDTIAAWQSDYDNAPLSSKWSKEIANALRDALRSANKQSKAVLRELTDGDWMFLVERERRADAWYERAEYKAEQIAQAERSALESEQKQRTGKSSGTSTHELDGQVLRDANGDWIATCPDCQRTFKNAEYRKAMNALTSHVGRWCVVRNADRKEVAFSANGHAKE